MVDMIVAELDRNGGGLLSLGCGNAAVEAEVIRRGHDVVAIDAMEVAVQMARLKNVDAVCADIYQWDPQRTWAVAYIDGVLGHRFDSMVGLVPVLSRIRTWLAPNADSASGVATLIASNDAPKDGSDVQSAPGVNGFHWLSAPYIGNQESLSGYSDVRLDVYRYRRPVSGERSRSIVIGHVT